MNIGLIILLVSLQLEAVIGQQETGHTGQLKSDGHTGQALPPLDCEDGDDECLKLQQSLGEIEDVSTQLQKKSVTSKINGNVGSSQVRDKDTSYASKDTNGQAKQGDSTIANQAGLDDDADKNEWRTDGRYTQKRVGQHKVSNDQTDDSKLTAKDSKHKESIKHWLLRKVNVLKSAVSTIYNKLFNHKGEDLKSHDSTVHSKFFKKLKLDESKKDEKSHDSTIYGRLFHTGDSKKDRKSHKSTFDSGMLQRGQTESTENNPKSDKENAHGSKRQMRKDESPNNVDAHLDSGATRSKSTTHRPIDHKVMKDESQTNDVSAHGDSGATRIKTTTHQLIDRLADKAMKSHADSHADHAENHNEKSGNDNVNRNNLWHSFQEEMVHQRLKRQAHNDQFDETISDDDNSPVHYAGKPNENNYQTEYSEKKPPRNRHRRSILLDAVSANVDERVTEKVKQQDTIQKVDGTPIQSTTDVSNKHLPEHKTMEKLADTPMQISTDVFKKKHEEVKKRDGTPVQSTTTLLSKLLPDLDTVENIDIFNTDLPDPSIMPEVTAANYSLIVLSCSGILAIITMCLLLMVIGKHTMVWCKRRREPSDFEKMNHIYFTAA